MKRLCESGWCFWLTACVPHKWPCKNYFLTLIDTILIGKALGSALSVCQIITLHSVCVYGSGCGADVQVSLCTDAWFNRVPSVISLCDGRGCCFDWMQRAGFEMHVCTPTTCPGICLLALSPLMEKSHHHASLHSQQHCQSETTLRLSGRFFFFFFGLALGVWAACCCTPVWINEVPNAVSVSEA